MEPTRWEEAAVDPEPLDDAVDEVIDPIDAVPLPRTPEASEADWVDQQLDAPIDDDAYDR